MPWAFTWHLFGPVPLPGCTSLVYMRFSLQNFGTVMREILQCEWHILDALEYDVVCWGLVRGLVQCAGLVRGLTRQEWAALLTADWW